MKGLWQLSVVSLKLSWKSKIKTVLENKIKTLVSKTGRYKDRILCKLIKESIGLQNIHLDFTKYIGLRS